MTSANKLISIVIPVYNRKSRLSLVVDSLLKQSFKGQLEIVLVDDGSNDGCCDIMESIDARINVITQKNQGAAVARHTGVMNAKGGIVIFHDSDDIARNNKVSTLVQALYDNPSCVSAFAITQEKRKGWVLPEWVKYCNKNKYYIFKEPLQHYFCNNYPLAGAMNIAMYKSVAVEATANSAFYKAANDFHLQFKAAFSGSVVGTKEVTNDYFTDCNESITGQYGHYKQEMFTLFSLIENYNNNKKIAAPYYDSLQGRVEKETFNALIYLAKNRSFNGYFWPLLRIALRYGRWRFLPKQVYWAIERQK